MPGGPVVCSPLAGRLLALSVVPDPVFAEEMVGPGIVIDPERRHAAAEVLSPVEGTIGALHPHAFAVENPRAAVLVHLGLDTVTLGGAPFTVLVSPGQEIAQGQPVVRWRIEAIGALSPLVPVVALGAARVHLLAAPGDEVGPGTPLFRVEGRCRG